MKKTISILCSTAVAALLLCSCSSSSVCVGDLRNDDTSVRVKTIHANHFVSGLIGHKDVNAAEYVQGCPDYKVKKYRSFVDTVLGYVTLGIYTPSTVEIYLPADYKARMAAKQQ